MDEAKTEGYYTQQRADMFGFVPQQARRILEIGCGQGTFLATLARDDRELWGIELDPDMARHAEKVCHRPRKPLHGGPQRLFDRFYLARCQQFP